MKVTIWRCPTLKVETRHWLSSGDHRCECDVMGQASERLVSCLGVSVALFVDGRHACMTQSAAALPGHNGRRRAGRPAGQGRAADGRTDGRLNACDGRRVISLSWRPWWRSLAAATITISCRTECLPACMAAAVMVAGRRRWSGLLNNLVQPCSDNDANHSVQSLRQTRPPPLCFTAIVHVTLR